MQKKIPMCEILYRTNQENGRVIIDIALNRYNEFFHEWDNSIFRKRDIHQELAIFLDLCSEEIPLKRKLEIQFCVKNTERNSETEDRIRASYKNYYSALLRGEQRKTKGIARTSGILLLVAAVLLFLHVFLDGVITSSILTKVFHESLLIGGWVFTWEAIHGLTIDIITPFRRCKEIQRFILANLTFSYTKADDFEKAKNDSGV